MTDIEMMNVLREEIFQNVKLLLTSIDHLLYQQPWGYLTRVYSSTTKRDQIMSLLDFNTEIFYFGAGYTRLKIDPVECTWDWVEISKSIAVDIAEPRQILRTLVEVLQWWKDIRGDNQ